MVDSGSIPYLMIQTSQRRTETKFLKFGNRVIIKGRNAGTNLHGYLSAVGHQDNRIFLQKTDIENNLLVPNLNQLVFQVHPKLYFSVQQEYEQYLKKMRTLRLCSKQSLSKEKEFKEKLQLQLKNNQNHIERNLGKKVNYGQVICLYHINSKRYATVKFFASLVEKSGFQFRIDSNLDKGILLKIVPRYKLRNLGEPIPFGDDILIESINFNMRLNYKNQGLHEFDMPKLPSGVKNAAFPFPILKNKATHQLARYEVYMSVNVQTQWQLVEFQDVSLKEEAGRLFSGQLVRLRHTQSGKILSSGFKLQEKSKEIPLFLKEYKEGNDDISVQDIWQFDVVDQQPYGRSIICRDYSKIVLRHFATGRLVHIKDIKQKNIKSLVLSKQQFSPVKFFECQNDDQINFVFSGGNFNILFYDNSEQGLVISDSQLPFPFASTKSKYFYQPPKEKDLQFGCSLVKAEATHLSARNAIQVIKLTKEQQQSIVFTLSFKQYAWRFMKQVKNSISFLDPFEVKSFRTIVEGAIRFLTREQSTNSTLLELKAKQPVEFRQICFKTANIIQILCCILYYAFENKKVSFNQEINKQILQMFKSVYLAINLSIKEVRSCQIYASRWIDLFIYHTKQENKINDLWAEPTLTELLDNNYRLLTQNVMRPSGSVVSIFVNLLKQQKKTKYLKILTALVNCEGKPIIANQIELINLIFREPEKTITIRWRGTLELQCDFNYLPIDRLENQEHIQYYAEFFRLLSNICLSKNYQGIGKLKPILPLQALVKLTEMEALDYRLRQNLYLVMQNLWIDSLHNQLTYPVRMRCVSDMTSDVTIEMLMQEHRSYPQFDALKQSINVYIEHLKQHQGLLSKPAQLRIFGKVLDIIFLFVKYGIYSSQQAVNNISATLYKFLKINKISSNQDIEEGQVTTVNNCLANICDIILFNKTIQLEQRITIFIVQLFAKGLQIDSPDLLQVAEEISVNQYKTKKTSKKYIVSLLFSLIVIKDHYRLNWLALQLLAKEVFKSLFLVKQLSILELVDSSDKDQYDELLRLRSRLAILADTCQIWYCNSQEKHQMLEVCQVIDGLSGLMLSKSVTFSQFVQDWQLDVSQTQLYVIKNFQRYLMWMSIHIELLKILEYDVFRIQVSKSTGLKDQLLFKIYCCLTIFVQGNEFNKQQLLPYLQIFKKHLETNLLVGSNIFLKELFTDNAFLLNDQKRVVSAMNDVCNHLSNLQAHTIHKRRELVGFLISLMCCNGYYLDTNQVLCLNHFTNKHQVLTSPLKLKLNELSQVRDFQAKLEKGLQGDQSMIQVPDKLQLYVQMMRVFVQSTREMNDINEKKIRYFIDQQRTVQSLKALRNNYLLNYYFLLYYSNVFLINDQEADSIRHQAFAFLIAQLERLLEIILKYNICQMAQSRIKHIYFEKANVSIAHLFLRYTFDGVIMVLNKLVRQIERVNYNTDRIVNSVMKIMSSNFQKLKVLEQGSYGLIDLVEQLNPKAFEGLSIRNHKSRRTTRSLRYTVKLQQAKNHPLRRFNLRMQSLLQGEQFLQLQRKQFKRMIRMMRQAGEVTIQELGANKIQFQDLLKSLVNMVLPQNAYEVEFHIFALKLLRNIIEHQNQDETKPVADWDTADWIQNKFNIKKIQKMLADIGLVQSLCQIIANQNTDLKVLLEALHLCIAMLIGGNLHVQSKFEAVLKQDKSNRIMSRIYELLSKSFEQLRNIYDDLEKLLFTKSSRPDMESQAKIQLFLEDKVNYQDQKRLFIWLFRILQLLCEGHNLSLQNLLRDQSYSSARSYNMIQFSCLKLRVFFRFFSRYSLDLGLKLLQFLIESVQGPCPQNQVESIKQKIVESIRQLFSSLSKQSDYSSKDFITQEQIDSADELVSLGAKMLLSLTQGPLNHQVYFNIHQNSDYSDFKKTLTNQYKQTLQEFEMDFRDDPQDVLDRLILQNDILPQRIQDSFSIYFLLCYLHNQHSTFIIQNQKFAKDQKYLKGYQPLKDIMNIKNCTEEEEKSLKFYTLLTRSIQVKVQSNVTRVYFFINPACYMLSKQSRKEFMLQVKRTSATQKVTGILHKINEFTYQMKHLRKMNGLPISVTIDRYNFMQNINILIAVLINLWGVFVITLSTYVDKQGQNQYSFTSRIDLQTSKLVYRILAAVQCFFYVLMLVGWLLLFGPLVKSRGWSLFNQSNKQLMKAEMQESLLKTQRPSNFTLNQIMYAFNIKGPYNKVWKIGQNYDYGNLYGKLYYWFKSMSFILSNTDLLLMVCYISLSIAGLVRDFPEGTMFFSFQLLSIIKKSQVFQSVIKSITLNIWSLITSYIFGVILMYIFAAVAFYYLAGDTYFALNGLSELLCDTLANCFINFNNYGLRNGGGISQSMRFVSISGPDHFYIRGVFDILFFWLIQVIFLNLFFGIVIDTFAELRNKRNQIQEDMNNRCFVCNIERMQFEKYTQGFQSHIDRQHQVWDYFWYLFYLKEKDQTQYTGMQSHIQEQVGQNDVNWFPVHRSISLEQCRKGLSSAQEES